MSTLRLFNWLSIEDKSVLSAASELSVGELAGKTSVYVCVFSPFWVLVLLFVVVPGTADGGADIAQIMETITPIIIIKIASFKIVDILRLF